MAAHLTVQAKALGRRQLFFIVLPIYERVGGREVALLVINNDFLAAGDSLNSNSEPNPFVGGRYGCVLDEDKT